MDLTTGYEARARSNRRPRRRVIFDERARAGAPGGPAGTYQTGLFGEELVADTLIGQGWHVLGHRVRTRVGELDLVARRDDTVVFVEVKTAGPGRVEVERSLDARSRHRIRKAAVMWMATNHRLQRGVRHYRFDVYIVRRDHDGAITKIDHIRDAF